MRIHFSCFALLAFCCIFTGMDGGAACLLAVLLHEAAHILILGLLHALPSRLVVTALGCRMICTKENFISEWQQAAVSLAGPGMNWLCFLLAAALHGENAVFAKASLALGMIHSLPIEPLDGGLALRYILKKMFSEENAERISRMISATLLLPLGVLGFLVLLRTHYNYSLLALSLYLMLYLVMGQDYTEP